MGRKLFDEDEHEHLSDTVWGLFLSCFKIRDEIIVLDDDDRVIAGRLTGLSEDGCTIRSIYSQKDRTILWENVAFISHDGFPIKKMNEVGGEALLKLDTEDTQETIRKALTHKYEEGKWRLDDGTERPRKKVERIVRGDPFLIEDVYASLYNPGNVGPEYWCSHFEETLLLEANDGAKANVYALPTVFHMEFA